MNMTGTKTIVGVWKNDVTKTPQSYEFNTWREAIDWLKKNKSHFQLWFHCYIPDGLPF